MCWSRCCRRSPSGAGSGVITGRSSTRSAGSSAPALPGVTCPNVTARGRPPINVSPGGRPMARARPILGHAHHTRAGRRHPAADPVAGPGPRRPARRDWPAAQPTGVGDRRQGLLLASQPAGPARQADPYDDPRVQRPDREPATPRFARWSTTRVQNADAYPHRNQVERDFNRRKHRRGLATRFDKLGVNYQATLDLVEMLDWLRAVPDGHDPRDRTWARRPDARGIRPAVAAAQQCHTRRRQKLICVPRPRDPE